MGDRQREDDNRTLGSVLTEKLQSAVETESENAFNRLISGYITILLTASTLIVVFACCAAFGYRLSGPQLIGVIGGASGVGVCVGVRRSP